MEDTVKLTAENQLVIQQIKNNLINHRHNVTINGIKYCFWPLFLVNQIDSNSEIDTCGTAMGVLCFSDDPTQKLITTDSLKAILWLRNEDGSWPSKVSNLNGSEEPKREGVINDTVYALTALLDAGFLDDKFSYTLEYSKTHINLLDLKSRYFFFEKSIQWLIANRVNKGWDYKGTEYLRGTNFEPSVLPTVRVIILFSKIMKIFEDIKTIDDSIHRNISDLKNEINETLDWLISIQNSDGGIGKKRGKSSTIVHSALAIIALLQSNQKHHIDHCIKCMKYLLKTKDIFDLNSLKHEELFDEYEQIIVERNGNIYKAMINHENFVEEILIRALTEFIPHKGKLTRYEIYKYSKLLKSLLFEIKNRQEHTGQFSGAISSRRASPDEKYPIYTSWLTIDVLKLINTNFQAIMNIVRRPLWKPFYRMLLLFVILEIIILVSFFYGKKDNIEGASVATVVNLAINIIANQYQKRRES